MKNVVLLIISLLCCCIACQRNLPTGQIASALGPEMQRFTIKVGRDTVVRCKGGMVLRFCPNTFVGAEDKVVLEVQEVRNRGEAFLLGISTLSSDGRLLETEGMMYLQGTTSSGKAITINPDCPIRLEIPVAGRRVGAKWFKGVIGGGETPKGLTWNEIPDGLINQTDISNLATGQQLFKSLCTPCHCPSLDVWDFAPPLGNITRFRDKAWLRQFTRNSQVLIASGDSLASCLWDRWKPIQMSSFPQLSDAQIDAIYQYIEEESARLNVQVDSTYYVCQPVLRDTFSGDYAATPFDTADLPPAANRPLVIYPQPNPYFAKISQFGWHNCDLFLNDTTAQPAVVKVNIPDAGQYDELLVGVLFDQLNSNIQLDDYGQGQFETRREWSVRFPKGPARIVAFGVKGKKWFQYEQPFTVGASNEFIATMQATSFKKIQAFIKANTFTQPQVEKEQCKFPN